MAALSLGSSVLSAVLQVVFDRATTYAQQQLLGANSELNRSIQKLRTSLSAIQSMIADAEKRARRTGDDGLRTWLVNLRDVVYDADDVFDQLEYERLKKDVMRARNRGMGSLRYAIMKRYSVTFSEPLFTAKVKEIQDKIENILSVANYFKLEMIAEQLRPVNDDYSQGRMTTPILDDDEEEIVGRKKEKDYIISLLLDEGSADGSGIQAVTNQSFTVIPLFGMGGVGKTTLAQLIFHDSKVKSHFELRIWVCVSDDFNEERIVNDILNSDDLVEKSRKDDNSALKLDDTSALKLSSRYCNKKNLRENLKDALKERKFLLVLDDIWNEDRGKWKDLAKKFNSGKQGSKILMTSRSKAVASILSPSQPIEIGCLSESDFLPYSQDMLSVDPLTLKTTHERNFK